MGAHLNNVFWLKVVIFRSVKLVMVRRAGLRLGELVTVSQRRIICVPPGFLPTLLLASMVRIMAYLHAVQSHRAPPRRMSELTANGSAVDGDGAIVARLPSLSSSLSPLSTFLNGI